MLFDLSDSCFCTVDAAKFREDSHYFDVWCYCDREKRLDYKEKSRTGINRNYLLQQVLGFTGGSPVWCEQLEHTGKNINLSCHRWVTLTTQYPVLNKRPLSPRDIGKPIYQSNPCTLLVFPSYCPSFGFGRSAAAMRHQHSSSVCLCHDSTRFSSFFFFFTALICPMFLACLPSCLPLSLPCPHLILTKKAKRKKKKPRVHAS